LEPIRLRITRRVVTHQDLGQVGLEVREIRADVGRLVLVDLQPGALERDADGDAVRPGPLGHARAERGVDQNRGRHPILS
jgi:hypothetical protein